MKPIILASASPRRKDLFKLLGVKFKIKTTSFFEDIKLPLPPKKLAEHLALGKAKAVAARLKKGIVIGADTMVVLKGKIIGKPRDKHHARRILKSLSGRAHEVVTGFAVLDLDVGKTVSRSVVSKVHFKSLTAAEIKDYIASGEPLDKAGAYGIQGKAARFIRRVQGDYFNVVGLPVRELAKVLKTKFGIKIKLQKTDPPF